MLPVAVTKAGMAITKDHALFHVASRLITPPHDLEGMWRKLELQHKGDCDELWVFAYLQAVNDSLPKFDGMEAKEKKKHAARIEKLKNEIDGMLGNHGLEEHIAAFHSPLNGGMVAYFLEDFSEEKQSDACKLAESRKAVMLDTRKLLNTILDRAGQQFSGEATGKNAVRFIRGLAVRNHRVYQAPLLGVIATTTNLLFGTHYEKNHVSELLNVGSET